MSDRSIIDRLHEVVDFMPPGSFEEDTCVEAASRVATLERETLRLMDIIHEMLDANGHMCSGLHDIMECYQVDESRAQEIRNSAKMLEQ